MRGAQKGWPEDYHEWADVIGDAMVDMAREAIVSAEAEAAGDTRAAAEYETS